MSWIRRHTERVLTSNCYVRVVADDSAGVPYIVQALDSARAPLVWLGLERGDRANAIRIGNKLSEAIRVAFGAPLFGLGMPYSYGLSHVDSYVRELGPVRWAISEAQHNPDFVQQCIKLASRHNHVLIATSSAEDALQAVEWPEPVVTITLEDLLLDESDAVDLFPNLVDEVPLEECLSQARGHYESFIAIVNARTKLPPPIRPAPGGDPEHVRTRGEGAGLLNALLARGRWHQAFEVAIDVQPDKALEIITEAADDYFSKGEVERLASLLMRLRSKVQPNAKLMYWLFQAYASIGLTEEVAQQIQAYLRHNAAPELRAAYASSTRHKGAMGAARQALNELRTPETLAATGFLETFHGEPAYGLSLLREAFQGYTTERRFHRAVQIANSIGAAYVRAGEYQRGVYWGSWSLDELNRRGLTEELLRLSTVNLVAFSKLLIGESESGYQMLADLHLPGFGTEIPTLEGLVTTIGDYHLVRGDIATALEYYKHLTKSVSSNLFGYAAYHLVRGYIHQGRTRSAMEIAGQAIEVSADSDEVNQALAKLSFGLARLRDDPTNSFDWSELEDNAVIRSNGPWLAEVAMTRAYVCLAAGREEEAAAILKRNERVLRELGEDGWRLLSGPEDEFMQMRGLAGIAPSPEVELGFLGARRVATSGAVQSVSIRFAEVLVCLALNPQGLSGEALLLEVYGDFGKLATLKSVLSRLRNVVRIGSQPYRINAPFTADFLQMETLLGEGRVREALELYKGPLLPESEAPGVQRARERLDESVRQAVLHHGDRDLLIRLAKKFPNDLELWERAQEVTPHDDPAYPLVRARVRRIRGDWGL